MIMNIGRMNRAPFFMAILEPKILPAIPKIAAGSPICHIIWPLMANVTNAAIFDARFTTFAFPEAVKRSKPLNIVKHKIRNVPVPGPKNPS